MSSDWLFLLDSEWSIPPGSNRNWLYSEFPVIFIPRNWFSTKPEKPKSRFNSKPKSHFLEIIPIISRYYVLVPPRITLLSTRKSTFRDEKIPSLFCFPPYPSSHLSINQVFFLLSRLFSRLKKELGRTWEWDAWSGCSCKKRSRTRRISLKFI